MKASLKPLPDFNKLSLTEQVAQMIIVRASGYLFDHQIRYPAWEPPTATLQYWLQELGIGGVILKGGNAGEIAIRSQQLQAWSKVPLLIAAELEEGVGHYFAGATWFPPPMAIGTIALESWDKAQRYAEQMGAITAQEALALGINWILAPVVDVNNNPLNPVLNVRAFGVTPETVSPLACRFIQGTQYYPVLTTAKHFPGHGDIAADSDFALPVLPHPPARLATVELPPFKDVIVAGVDAVMSAHLLIPSWDAERPATLSQPILTELLREYLGFGGLIVTDTLSMRALSNRYGTNAAPVLAVEAGADILLVHANPEEAILAVCSAVASGRISRARIQASLERIWKAKHKVIPAPESREAEEFSERGAPSQTVPPPNLLQQVAQPAALTTVANILRDSLRIGGSLPLPLEPTNSIRQLRNIIVVDDALACDFLGQHTPAIAFPRKLGYELQLVDCHTPLTHGNVDNAVAARPTVLQLFIRGNLLQEGAEVMPLAEQWFKRLLKNDDLQALVIYGSPYALEQFLPKLPPDTPYVFSYGQMPQAQAIALEVLFSQSVMVNTSLAFI